MEISKVMAGAIGSTMLAAVVTALVTPLGERLTDIVLPGDPPAPPAPGPVLAIPEGGRTTIVYPQDVELVAEPGLRAWGGGSGAEALATDTRPMVATALRIPAELAAARLDYQISNVSPGGQNRKRTARVDTRIATDGAERKCGPETLAFRDSRDLADQIAARLNAIVFASFMGENLSCA